MSDCSPFYRKPPSNMNVPLRKASKAAVDRKEPATCTLDLSFVGGNGSARVDLHPLHQAQLNK